jgi:hypothetical protein
MLHKTGERPVHDCLTRLIHPYLGLGLAVKAQNEGVDSLRQGGWTFLMP